MVPAEEIPGLTAGSDSVFPLPFDPTGLDGEIIIKRVTRSRPWGEMGGFVVSLPLGTRVVSPFSQKMMTIPMAGHTEFCFDRDLTFLAGAAYLGILVAPGVPRDYEAVQLGQVLGEVRSWALPSYIAEDNVGEEGGETWEALLILSDPDAVDLKEEHLLKYNGSLVFVRANQ